MSPLTLEFAREIGERPACGWTLVGVIADAIDLRPAWRRYPIVGPPDHLKEILNQLQPQRVIVAVWDGRSESSVNALAAAHRQGTVVQGADEAYEALTGRITAVGLTSSVPEGTPRRTWTRLDAVLRRGLGIAVARIGILILTPRLMTFAIAVRIDSKAQSCFAMSGSDWPAAGSGS